MKNYGAVIAKLRKSKGLTQGQLGKQLNVSYQAVSKWENNISEPDLQTIEKLTDIFEISMSDFFSMAKNPNEVNNAPSHKEQVKEPVNFIKTKPWILAVILGAIIAVLTLCALLIPVNYSSKQVFAKYDQSLFFVSAKTANGATKTGSGFFINDSGLAVTIYSNIKDCTNGTIQLNNGEQYSIENIVGVDEDNNIAIIQIDIEKSKPVKFGDSNDVEMGDKVYSLTYSSKDKLDDATSIITEGMIFKIESDSSGTTSIQTTASIDYANKGGILFNANGKVIGIISGNLNISGIGFDMVNVCNPANLIKKIDKIYDYSLQEYFDKHFSFQFISDGKIFKSIPIFESQKIESITPSKSGYTFNGWYKDDSFETLFDFSAEITAATKCYAQWTPNTYNLTYSYDSNSDETDCQTLTYDQSISLLDIEYEKTGYIHQGWTTLDGSASFDKLQSVKNLTNANNDTVRLIALWTPIQYKINYNGNGATSGYMSTQTFKYDEAKMLKTNNFSKTGYLFNGWDYNDQSFNNEEEILNITTENSSTIELTAKWSPITYSFVFENPEDVIGTEYEIQPMDFLYDESKTINFETICYPKKIIESWSCSSRTDNGSTSYTIKDGSVVLNKTSVNNTVFTFAPIYNSSRYYIRYNSNGGTGAMSDQLVNYGEKVYLKSCGYTKKGYHFTYWTDNSCPYIHYDSALISSHSETHLDVVEFYANWSINYYYLSYYLEDTRLATLEYNESFTLPACPFTKPGYKFSHWEYDVWSQSQNKYITYELEDEETIVNLGNIETSRAYEIELKPVWTPIEYYVQFDSNGGVGQMQTITATYGKTISFENMFTKPNQTLLYWTCGDRVIDGNAIPTNLTTEAGETLTFKANWIDSFYGQGTESSPYQISSIEEFNLISEYLSHQYMSYKDCHFELICDIDATGKTIVAPYSFNGSFNGNNHIISNITNCTGLFNTFHGEIRNLHLKNFVLSTSKSTYIGPFATDAGSPVLENCSVTGTITYQGNESVIIGGLIGGIYNDRGNIFNCYSNMTINIIQDEEIESSEDTTRNYKIGGLVAYTYHYGFSVPTDEILRIQNCYAITDVNINTLIEIDNVNFSGLISSDTVYTTNCFTKYAVNIKIPEAAYSLSTFAKKSTTNKYTNCFVAASSKFEINGEQTTTFTNVVPWVDDSQITNKDWLVNTMLFDETIWLVEEGSLPTLKKE